MLFCRTLYKPIHLAVLMVCAMFGTVQAADPPADSSAGVSIHIFSQYTADSASSVIPFSRAGNLILVQASVDSTVGSFIVDTGCPHLVLNLTYFRSYPILHGQEEERTGMTGTVASSVQQTLVREFSIGTISHPRLEADLVNLGHIENSKGVKILGLIGMRLLNQCEMIIDFEKSLIYLHRVGKKERSTYRHEMLNDTAAYRTVPIDIMDDRIIVKTEMGGKKLKLIVDSGSESNVLDSRLPDKIFENVSITGRVMITGAGNKKIEAVQGDLKSLKIGNEETGTLPVLITNLEKTCFSYNGCVDGILGFDFLSLQKIGFNFVNRKMYIWK